MDYLKTAVRITKSSDFYLTEKMAIFLGAISPPANIGFYLFLKFGMGYHESVWLRGFVVVSTALFLFFPRDKPFSIVHKVYWEAVLVFALPFLFSYLLLHNSINAYWYTSLMWAGYVYGVLSSKIYLPLLAFPFGLLLGTGVYLIQTDHSPLTIVPAIGSFAIAWMSAICIGGVKLAINVFYILSLNATQERIRAEDALKRQIVLEHKNAELVARNAIISTFVRPSVVNEVNQGRDPRQFKPRLVDRAILICDMRNFTPLTDSMTDPDMQAQFLNKYFEMMIDPVFAAGGEIDKLMGDAVMAIFPDGNSALDAALRMRESLQIYNRQLVIAGMPKMANVISVAKGTILEANIGSEKKLDRTWIGTAVNVCARLEAVAKLYGIEVVVSEEVFGDLLDTSRLRLVDILRVKGYRHKFEVYEMYSHQAPEVIAYKDSTKDALRRGIYAYFRKGSMQEASQIFMQLLDTMPQHRHRPGKLMDTLVYLYAHRCRQFLENSEIVPKGLDLNEGCHDFSSDLMPRDWYNILHPEAISRLHRSASSSLEIPSPNAEPRVIDADHELFDVRDASDRKIS